MVKTRISATIDEETGRKIEEFLKKSKHRNKAHFIEEAILKFIDDENQSFPMLEKI